MTFIDLHRHIEGSITPFVAECLGRPLDSRWDKKVDFFESWGPIVSYIRSPDVARRIIYHSLHELAKKGAIYVEYLFSPAEFAFDPREYCYALHEGAKTARAAFGIESGLIYNLTRHLPETIAHDLTNANMLADRGIISGIGIAGDERNFPLEMLLPEIMPQLRHDFPLTVHAGEFGSSDEIEAALDLGARRIGHGVSAAKRTELLDRIGRDRIGIEVCLTSEMQLSKIAALDLHPIYQFADAEIVFNLNTDDPALFGTEIDREYALAEAVCSSRQINTNALEMAFAPEDLKSRLRAMIEP